VEELVRRTGATIVVPLYPRIGQGGAAVAHAWLQEVYQRIVMRAGANAVFLLGDSAGGGLALACALSVRDRAAQLRQPDGVILISPWIDVTMTNPQIVEFERRDVLLSAAGLRAAGTLWAGELDVRDVRVSPLCADLAGLPGVYVFQGDRDVLAPDAVLLVERLRAAGGAATMHMCRGGFHDYIMAPFTTEARQARDRVCAIINEGAEAPGAGLA
jgi:RND superfamily putative drug exporter